MGRGAALRMAGRRVDERFERKPGVCFNLNSLLLEPPEPEGSCLNL